MDGDVHEAPKASANACLACRRVKMKCTMTLDAVKCDRCVRKSLDCMFREHRRGRKPGTRLIKPNSKRALDSPQGPSIPEGIAPEAMARRLSSPKEERVSDFWADSEGLQPNGLLSHHAMKGKFSLQNILSTNHGSTPDRQVESVSPDDPIRCGLVSYELALRLFESFMTKLNPFVSQLDPHLHSFEYVRQKSSFLFGAILTAASKSFETSLYPSLHEHAEKLYMEAFRRGDKSAETVQAIMVLTYWKEPNDTRAWMSVGLAIRMSIDLGWHKLGHGPARQEQLTDIQQREIRNDERTWLVLFVYDRSMSLQTGKPWMIERTPFIESAQDWWKHPLAIDNDRLLCAFVTLRLLAAEVFDLSSPGDHFPAPRPLSVLQNRIEQWQNKWLDVVDPGKLPHGSCHNFMIRFYGAHQSLQLFSMPLQETLKNKTFNETSDLKPFWISYHSATNMLRLMAEISPFLSLCQDSIHVMTAYSAVLLIKLLLSSPPVISQEIEPDTIATIRTAANVFTSQTTPLSTSCSLQSRFLNNILGEFATLRRPRPTERTRSIGRPHGFVDPNAPSSNASFPDSPATAPSQHSPIHQTAETHTIPTARPYPPPNPPNPDQVIIPPQSHPPHPQPLQAQYFHRPSIPNGDPIYDTPMTSIPHGPNGLPAVSNMGYNNQIDSSSNFVFSDEAMWVGMFASAGFNLQDGVFCG
ncbi:uncharacterized protein N7511_000590 [Penicillium nucicola]|uniref:uncharacterized protein n=1 Tax=Penicillium nucicola TaxID=1850975 RepID=UPI002544E07D|nr:uncharacterized protein N7511_000590 [Penicillium nucicola]KAJ5775579.1 hypothetical protein N7511_000590 [Penicillium nucicola]